jgi:hypothetical protein
MHVIVSVCVCDSVRVYALHGEGSAPVRNNLAYFNYFPGERY